MTLLGYSPGRFFNPRKNPADAGFFHALRPSCRSELIKKHEAKRHHKMGGAWYRIRTSPTLLLRPQFDNGRSVFVLPRLLHGEPATIRRPAVAVPARR